MATNTNVLLLNMPLSNDYQHTYAWETKAQQTEYFMSKFTGSTPMMCTYQRKDNVIRYPAHIDSLYQYNYVMYKNLDYTDKWFYAFIKEFQYVNDGHTDIIIETDVLQTWYFEKHVGQSFIEREHVDDDTIGKHTIPENIERGEYVVNGYTNVPELKAKVTKVVMGSTYNVSEEEDDVGGIYNGIYSGVKYYVYPTSENNDNNITAMLQKITNDGKQDAVTSLFLAPDFLLPGAEGGGSVTESVGAQYLVKEVPKTYGFEGYIPKNNKLNTSQYTYLLVSNGSGATAEYGYEYFETENDCSFQIVGALTPGCSIRLRPTIYKGQQLNELEGLNLGKYPQCNWATDQFVNWLTQNAVNVGGQVATSVTGGIMTGAGASAMLGMALGTMAGPVGWGIAAVGAIVGIASTINEVAVAERVPAQTKGNINCGDVVNSIGDNTFHFYNMSIRKEYAEMIDKYFDMYGYKVNRLGTPKEYHRSSWWFTKTIDANISGAIPKDDLEKIKRAYNNGITFWCKPGYFRNYEIDNSIVE